MLIWIIINNRCLFVTNISCYQFYQIFYRFLLCKYLGNDKNCLYLWCQETKKNNSALWTINCQFQIKRNIRKRMKKTKNRYFKFALHCKRPDLIRTTIFVRIACQTPRCRNLRWSLSRDFTLQLARSYNAAGPTERARWI